MNKAILGFMVLGLAVAAQAAQMDVQAAQIKSLSCVAANGVILKSVDASADRPGLNVSSQWGIFSKTFTATLVPVGAEDTHTFIELTDQSGGLGYFLDLAPALKAAVATSADVPERFGTLQQAPVLPNGLRITLATVSCELQLVD